MWSVALCLKSFFVGVRSREVLQKGACRRRLARVVVGGGGGVVFGGGRLLECRRLVEETGICS